MGFMMFVLHLSDVGANRQAVIVAAARVLGVSLADAKARVDSSSREIAGGDAKWIAFVRKQLENEGARVVVSYQPEETEWQSYVSDKLSIDKRTCRKCGAPLFFAIPGRTTEEEVVEFARNNDIPNAKEI